MWGGELELLIAGTQSYGVKMELYGAKSKLFCPRMEMFGTRTGLIGSKMQLFYVRTKMRSAKMGLCGSERSLFGASGNIYGDIDSKWVVKRLDKGILIKPLNMNIGQERKWSMYYTVKDFLVATAVMVYYRILVGLIRSLMVISVNLKVLENYRG